MLPNTPQRMATEPCYLSVTPVSESRVKFIGVYRGINSAKQIFLLMSHRNVTEFNAMAQTFAVTECHTFSAKQIMNSRLNITKLKNGWNIGGTHLPFNPVCTFTFDFSQNELVSIAATNMYGTVHNIDCRQMDHRSLVWIKCLLKCEAIEDHKHRQTLGKCGLISSIQFLDNSNAQFQDSKVSYLMHDWDYVQFKGAIGDNVECCMKLSTKTNTKCKLRRRPVFIQTWNVRQS